ncbi:MAG: trypsin-like peptidase domain-containing protein [Planctomycetes bacterium]|nr:trypsin-like peptidase domain-containing protein [Planctomycetota bacterium]
MGDYAFERIVYEGEHTTTYRAVHRATGEAAAVVRFLYRLSHEQIERFTGDLARLQTIPGDRVIRVLGFHVTQDGEAYRVKAWVDGAPVPVLIRRGYFKPLSTAFWFLEEVVRAVEDLHAAGFRATYLLPDDILITGTGKEPSAPRAIRVNFHGPRFLDRSTDRPGPSLRHLLDHHPDLQSSSRLVPQSDIYTLGVIFFEVLVGERPGREPTPDAVRRLPAPLETLVLGMLHDDPTRRPQTTADVRAALARARRTLPAQPDQRAAGARQSDRRRRRSWLAIGAAIVLLVAAVWVHRSWFPGGAIPPAVQRARESVMLLWARYSVRAPEEPDDGEWLARAREEKREGTAFLIEPERLLTARHVGAPWYEGLGYGAQCKEARERVAGFRRRLEAWPAHSPLWAVDERGEWRRNYDRALTSVESRLEPEYVGQAWDGRGESLSGDVMVLRIRLPSRRSLPFLELAEPEEWNGLKVGDPVFMWSFPNGSEELKDGKITEPTFARGEIDRIRQQDSYLFTSLQNYGGSSGAPILNASGRVIGIALQALGPEGQQTHTATRALGLPALRQFLEEVRSGRASKVWEPVPVPARR